MKKNGLRRVGILPQEGFDAVELRERVPVAKRRLQREREVHAADDFSRRVSAFDRGFDGAPVHRVRVVCAAHARLKGGDAVQELESLLRGSRRLDDDERLLVSIARVGEETELRIGVAEVRERRPEPPDVAGRASKLDGLAIEAGCVPEILAHERGGAEAVQRAAHEDIVLDAPAGVERGTVILANRREVSLVKRCYAESSPDNGLGISVADALVDFKGAVKDLALLPEPLFDLSRGGVPLERLGRSPQRALLRSPSPVRADELDEGARSGRIPVRNRDSLRELDILPLVAGPPLVACRHRRVEQLANACAGENRMFRDVGGERSLGRRSNQ